MNNKNFSLQQGNSFEVSQNCLTINLQLHNIYIYTSVCVCLYIYIYIYIRISASHSMVFKCLFLLAYACLQSTAVTLNNMKDCKKIIKMLLTV